MNKKIFITGATGTFGKLLLSQLLENNITCVVLVRASSNEHAQSRLESSVVQKILSLGGFILAADLTVPDFAIDPKIYTDLISSITHILHAAASTKFTLSLDEARRNNVTTTNYILEFAKKCSKLTSFGYISTAFIAGKRSGIIREDEFIHHEGFLNTYEQTKYEAEELVRKESNNLPLCIFRPSLILSPYRHTINKPINAIAFTLFMLKKDQLGILPGSPLSSLDTIPGENAATCIIEILLRKNKKAMTYHITAAEKRVTVAEIHAAIEEKITRRISITYYPNPLEFYQALEKYTRFRPDLSLVYKKLDSFIPELFYPKLFDNTHLRDEFSSEFLTNFSPLEEISKQF